jgi:hypothetical protein
LTDQVEDKLRKKSCHSNAQEYVPPGDSIVKIPGIDSYSARIITGKKDTFEIEYGNCSLFCGLLMVYDYDSFTSQGIQHCRSEQEDCSAD